MRIEIECGAWQAAPKAFPPGRAAFAIGDVHGHARHLSALQDFIRARIEAHYEAARTSLVWVGDYVDRGPEPLRCLDLAAAGLAIPGLEQVRLLGNHERFLLDNLRPGDHPAAELMIWISNGGQETIKAMAPDYAGTDSRGLAAALRDALGPERLEFLEGLTLWHRIGDYVFVHAGINPSRPLDAQSEEDLIWIREPFLAGRSWPHEVVVVHGHTPGDPVVLPHRIGIDSGVFYSGKLTAVEIAEDRLRFVTAADVNRGRRFWGSLFD